MSQVTMNYDLHIVNTKSGLELRLQCGSCHQSFDSPTSLENHICHNIDTADNSNAIPLWKHERKKPKIGRKHQAEIPYLNDIQQISSLEDVEIPQESLELQHFYSWNKRAVNKTLPKSDLASLRLRLDNQSNTHLSDVTQSNELIANSNCESVQTLSSISPCSPPLIDHEHHQLSESDESDPDHHQTIGTVRTNNELELESLRNMDKKQQLTGSKVSNRNRKPTPMMHHLHEHPLCWMERTDCDCVICDSCNKQYEGYSWHCTECDFDLCAECGSNQNESNQSNDDDDKLLFDIDSIDDFDTSYLRTRSGFWNQQSKKPRTRYRYHAEIPNVSVLTDDKEPRHQRHQLWDTPVPMQYLELRHFYSLNRVHGQFDVSKYIKGQRILIKRRNKQNLHHHRYRTRSVSKRVNTGFQPLDSESDDRTDSAPNIIQSDSECDRDHNDNHDVIIATPTNRYHDSTSNSNSNSDDNDTVLMDGSHGTTGNVDVDELDPHDVHCHSSNHSNGHRYTAYSSSDGDITDIGDSADCPSLPPPVPTPPPKPPFPALPLPFDALPAPFASTANAINTFSTDHEVDTKEDTEFSDDDTLGNELTVDQFGNVYHEDASKVYCICRQPYDERPMICCDICEEWYHPSCIGMTQKEFKVAKEGRFECPLCNSTGTSYGRDGIKTQQSKDSMESNVDYTTGDTTVSEEEWIPDIADTESTETSKTKKRGKKRKRRSKRVLRSRKKRKHDDDDEDRKSKNKKSSKRSKSKKKKTKKKKKRNTVNTSMDDSGDTDRPFLCSECGRRFRTVQTLRTHSYRQHREKKYKCTECGKSFMYQGSFDNHMKEHAPCKKCGRKFKHRKTKMNHELNCNPCSKCGRQFKYRKTRMNHERNCNRTRKEWEVVINLKCTPCNKSFRVHHLFVKHMSTVHGVDRAYDCHLCDEKYATRDGLMMHFIRKHDMKGRYQCDSCPRSFHWNSELTAHRQSHVQQ